VATVYFHIGAPKTATSTLQTVLAGEDGLLLDAGVLYPRNSRHANAHHPLVCDLMQRHGGRQMASFWYGDVAPGSAWSLLIDELAEHGDQAHTAVVSSELLFGQAKHLEPMIEELQALLAGHRLRVVVYLRRQDQLYASFYNQDVKGTRQWGESAYQFYQTHQLFDRDYHSLLSAWGAALGKDNVLIRPFEKSAWFDGDIVSDFCQLTGLPLLHSKEKEENSALGPTQLYVKRCLNRTGYDKSLNDEVLQKLARLLPEPAAGDCRYVNRRYYRQLREQWLLTNQRLAADFLDGQALFAAGLPNARDLVEYGVARSALVEFIERLVRHYRRREGEFRDLFARAACLIIAEQALWDSVDDDTRARLMSWT
jgi:hypothetical protein